MHTSPTLRHVGSETGARSETGRGQGQDRQRPAGRLAEARV